ncbi:MAG: endo-1,3-1,4-beta glucanase-related protein [Saprospiraceae bacterium]|nr:MAG: endo-1,3-1,4-beta glucanase-related protein [Saprospiraceae bacterium]
MFKHITLLFAGILLATISFAQQITTPEPTEVWEPVPRVVTPGMNNLPPSDAIVLFDGKNTNEWKHEDGSDIKWKVEDGALTVTPGSGDISTRQTFGDLQLHLEWRTPAAVKGEGQGRGNSGVFLQSRYEVQVLDNYQNKTYPNGQAGSIYKQSIPLVNACRPPGEWQTYDIIYTAPRFNADGVKVASAHVTVIQNGILVQNNTEIKGTSEYIGLPKNIAHGDDSLKLQDHSNPVSYRNIWVRKL